MVGLSTIGSISFGVALVAGRNLVPNPAAGITALVIFATIPSPLKDKIILFIITFSVKLLNYCIMSAHYILAVCLFVCAKFLFQQNFQNPAKKPPAHAGGFHIHIQLRQNLGQADILCV